MISNLAFFIVMEAFILPLFMVFFNVDLIAHIFPLLLVIFLGTPWVLRARDSAVFPVLQLEGAGDHVANPVVSPDGSRYHWFSAHDRADSGGKVPGRHGPLDKFDHVFRHYLFRRVHRNDRPYSGGVTHWITSTIYSRRTFSYGGGVIYYIITLKKRQGALEKDLELLKEASSKDAEA